MTSKPTVVEVGPRDGLQNEATHLSTTAKIAFIAGMVEAGVTRIEAVGFGHPRLVPALADAEQVMAGVPRPDGVSYLGLVLNGRGLSRAIDAGVDEANVVLVASETFSQRNQNMSIEDSLRSFDAIASRARDAGIRVTATIGAAFGCPFEGEVPTDRVAGIAARAAASGAHEVAIADTIGVGVPADVRRLAEAVAQAVDTVADVPLRAHFHNTRNTGYANAIAAVEAGIMTLDSSAGGFGGCPFAPNATGNIATEDLVYLLSRSGFSTGIDADAVVSVAADVARHLAKDAPALLGRAGGFPAGVGA